MECFSVDWRGRFERGNVPGFANGLAGFPLVDVVPNLNQLEWRFSEVATLVQVEFFIEEESFFVFEEPID